MLILPTSNPAQAQSRYDYQSYQVDIYIHQDTSLVVTEKASYHFKESQESVGLFIPSCYGTVGTGLVLDMEGNPLPEGECGYERSEDGYTLWCNSTQAAQDATYIYQYDIYDSLTEADGLIGLDWSAVPSNRSSSIEESSVVIHFPQEINPEDVELDTQSSMYSGDIFKGFTDAYTAFIQAKLLAPESSYSFRCYWPSSIMNLDRQATTPSWISKDSTTVKSWDFERFDVDIAVNKDSSFTVKETQVVNFHGDFTFLNRDLVTETASFSEGRTYGKVRIHDIQVYNLDGRPYDNGLWSVKSYQGSKTVHIEFQAHDEQKGWIISYRMTGALIFGPGYDRLYWDAVSEVREAPIKSSNITVKLPPGTNIEDVRTDFYPDPYFPPTSYDHGKEDEILWWSATEIMPYTNFTIDVAFPKGVVNIPWQYSIACGIAITIFSIVFFLTILSLMLALWWKKGRNLGRSGTTMVYYDPPEGLKPAMLGMLINEIPRVEDISATIVDLACKGKLSIFEEDKKDLLKSRKYGFQRLDQDQSDLLPYEKWIINALFEKVDQIGRAHV